MLVLLFLGLMGVGGRLEEMIPSNGKGSLPTSTSSCSWESADMVFDRFPAGLRVLVVDDDPTCLMILNKMLKTCQYEGITFMGLVGSSDLFAVGVGVCLRGQSGLTYQLL